MISRQAVRLLSRANSRTAAAATSSRSMMMPTKDMVGAAVATAANSTLASSTVSGKPAIQLSTMSSQWSSSSSSSPSSSPRRWMSSGSSSSSSNATTGEGEKKEDDTAATKEEEATAETGAESPSSPSKEEQLEAEIKALKDQLLRSYAEQENTRNIAKRDVQEARQFAIKSFAKSLLEVSDNLQRALESVPKDELQEDQDSSTANNNNVQLRSLFQGIEMTYEGLLKALQANGVEKYCEVPGDKFDPSLHNALMQYPDPAREPDTVGQVIKVGYTLNKRVLRPAEVGVVKKA